MGQLPACVLLCCLLTVTGHRLAGSAGLRCCQRILEKELPERAYRLLKSYRQIPQVGICPKYLEFNTTKGQTFCVLLSKAQRLKEFVDSRSAGMAGVPGSPRLASPNIARARPAGQEVTPAIPVEREAAPTIPVEQEATSTIPVEQEVAPNIPVEQEVTPAIPVEQEVAPTIPVEQEAAPTIPVEQEVAPTIPVEQEVASAIPVEREVVPTIPVEQEVAPTIPVEQEVAPTIPVEQEVAPTIPVEQEVAPTIPVEQEVAPTIPVEQEAASAAWAPGPGAETPAGTGTRGAAVDRETPSAGEVSGGTLEASSTPARTTQRQEERARPVTVEGEAASEEPGGSEGAGRGGNRHPSSPHRHRGASEIHRGRNHIYLVPLLLAAACILTLVVLMARKADRPTPATQAARIDLVHYSKVTGCV